MVKSRIEAKAYDSSTRSGAGVTLIAKDGNSDLNVTFYRNQFPELFDQYLARKDFDVDFSKVETKKEAEKLKEEILATKPQSKEEDYDRTLKAYKQAMKKERQIMMTQDIARMVTYDLAAAYQKGVSKERYANIVEYARNFLRSVGTKTPAEDIQEPKRNKIQRYFDKFLERDSLHYTKGQIAQWQEGSEFPRGKEAQEIFGQMAQNIPDEPMKSQVIHLKDCDPVATEFMEIYEKKTRLAMTEHSKAYADFVQELAKKIILQDAAQTFDEKYKTHLARIHARERLLDKKGRTAGTRGVIKKAVKAKSKTAQKSKTPLKETAKER